jgi:hypothetical protein
VGTGDLIEGKTPRIADDFQQGVTESMLSSFRICEAALAVLLALAGCGRAIAGGPQDSGVMGDQALADALGDLADEHAARFGPAIRWLVEHPERSRPVLLQWLSSPDDDMAPRRAFEVLGRIGRPEDVAPLAARLKGAREVTVAGDVARGLRLHPAPEAREALIAATASSSTWWRRRRARLAGRIRRAGRIPAVVGRSRRAPA